MALLLAALAWADAGLDGATGLIANPTAATVPLRRAQVAVGVQLGRGAEGVDLVGLPGGVAAGLLPRLELGARLERDVWQAWPSDPRRTAAGAHVRYRFVDTHRLRPALAAQLDIEGLGAKLGVSAGLISSLSVARALHLHASVMGRLATGQGTDVITSEGIELRLGRSVRLLAESSLAVDARGLHRWSARAGARLRARDRVALLGWGGGGRDDGAPWVAGGVSLELYSKEPTLVDVDADSVADWADRCPAAAEDSDGFRDEDGCPDDDNDGDGVPDLLDSTPNGEPEDATLRPPGERPMLKMRIRMREMPGPVDPGQRPEAAT